MVIHDINQNKREVILLIHPMNFSGKMMMDSMAKELGCAYRYIVPDLSGHGEAKDDPYVSTAEVAATLAHYIHLVAHFLAALFSFCPRCFYCLPESLEVIFFY